jgi:FkbM family methyltransferase
MIKNTIRYIFKQLGYSIVKNRRIDDAGYSAVKVGKFKIQINNNNVIKYCYEYCKDYGAQLSRLTALLSKYYNNLEVIDIGANLGDSVSLVKTGADVPVIAIEGDSLLIDLFNTNTEQFENVSLVTTFLSDSAGTLNCTFSKVGHNLTIVPSEKSKDTRETNFSDIDTLYKTAIINDNCKLLKVDTEGFDLKIIKGGDKFLAVVNPVIIFEFNRENLMNTETDPFSFFPWLLSKGYNNILFYESDGRFMFSSTLSNLAFMKQLFDYVDGKAAKIYYMDIVVFHLKDDALAHDFIQGEEKNRLNL